MAIFWKVFKLIILIVSLSLILAVLSHHYQVYLPGIYYLIPSVHRTEVFQRNIEPISSPIVKEKVIIIDSTQKNGKEEK